MAYRWKIATDQYGANEWEFKANPLDTSGVFPARSYTAIEILEASPILQFPVHDTQLRSVRIDMLPGGEEQFKQFLKGDSESDTQSLEYLKKLDSDGKLTIYWLHIPESTRRPYGWRDEEWIPVRFEDVIIDPEPVSGDPRWITELRFRIVPKHEADYTFKFDFSPFDSNHAFVTSKLSKAYVYDDSTSTYYDVTDVAYEGGYPFPSYFAVTQGDMIYAGCATKFYGVKFEMDTPETVKPDPEQGATEHAWEAWENSWQSLTVNDQSYFIKDSTVSWGAVSSWVMKDLSDCVVGAPQTDPYYWVRCIVGTVTTAWDINKLLRS